MRALSASHQLVAAAEALGPSFSSSVIPGEFACEIPCGPPKDGFFIQVVPTRSRYLIQAVSPDNRESGCIKKISVLRNGVIPFL